MADPVIVEITPANTWVKVATDVTAGDIHILKSGPDAYIHTYRDTTGTAPTLSSEGVRFDPSGSEEIKNGVGIDVYVMALNAPGAVRVDL